MPPSIYQDANFLRGLHIVPDIELPPPEPIIESANVWDVICGTAVICGLIIGSWLFVLAVSMSLYAIGKWL